MSRFALVVLAVLPVVVGCSSGSPTTPSPAAGPLAGVWTGTVSRPAGSIDMRLTLQESRFGAAYVISGRYEARDAAGTTTGGVGGGLLQSAATLTLTPDTPSPCGVAQPFPPGQFLLSLTLDSTGMAGPAVLTLCGGSQPGVARLTKP